ncbi:MULTISPECIES: heme o synthase [Pseudoalteromonas]|jgi:protoheme IX farnesyltransferase|uniref:Protoheme IX farnesyltransferase n=1 Tax=Pseudoalteromonas marina TaxID=267375 RepID=A0ABT9FF94_9GAMM|nr:MULTISPECIES: heme o synthase [Pseudoalteromonas]EAW26933.1 Polyprenyltransferase [Alteromonadales bacterium TW-7]ATG59507.1 protoheme IX farnesyltransferase [Pseudoalteromonas marina]KAF7774789.1 protoheme IX farnesyltransferase [Pseudoalteromonas marina]MCK8122969.1 heme o synthase [Pseudoalteromonas sp. 2CM32C]MDP2565459.1 heme o synthase [Pseudoalteromonas marina]|tara:strand:- start:17072 stop:18001 length:930 start_codon:yes stop_codon:yes gene_type:complete
MALTINKKTIQPAHTQSLSLRAYDLLQDYLAISKFKVVAMLVLTAWVGLALAPDVGRGIGVQMISLLGIGLLSAAAAVINHVVDSEIDSKMARTRHRPVAKGRLSKTHALTFAASIGIAGFIMLMVWANTLTAILTLFALVGYAFIYTSFLKRATPQNIVIGGLAGAMPPLLGWVSETNQMAAAPWLLVMIIFTWTPPHFWALAIARKSDYERAKIPMLPVTHGIDFCKTCVVAYSVLLALVCVMPYLIGMSGGIYLVGACALNSVFMYKAIKLKFAANNDKAMDLFRFSIVHLMVLFVILFIDKWLPL